MRLSGKYDLTDGQYFSLALHMAVLAFFIFKLSLFPHKDMEPIPEAVAVEIMVLDSVSPAAPATPQSTAVASTLPAKQPALKAAPQPSPAPTVTEKPRNWGANSLVYNAEPTNQTEQVSENTGARFSASQGNNVSYSETGSESGSPQPSAGCDGNIINLHALNNNPCAGPNRGWSYTVPIYIRARNAQLQPNITANGSVAVGVRYSAWAPPLKTH